MSVILSAGTLLGAIVTGLILFFLAPIIGLGWALILAVVLVGGMSIVFLAPMWIIGAVIGFLASTGIYAIYLLFTGGFG